MNTELERVGEMKDLGVLIDTKFKPEKQCRIAASKANAALFRLKKTVKSRRPRVLIPLFKAFVRPHLEYCVQAWGPYLKKRLKDPRKSPATIHEIVPRPSKAAL